MKILGSGRISEAVINDELRVAGSVRLEGNLECAEVRSSGSLRGEGDLTVHGDFRTSGSFRIVGSLYVDGNATASGSTSVGGESLIKGYLDNSGSFWTGSGVKALRGIYFTGSSTVEGDLTSQKVIEINGSTTINGSILGYDVFIGRLKGKFTRKHPFKIYGNINAKNNVRLIKTFVDGDVKGKNVIIGRRTEILGNVYYVDTIKIHPKARLAHEPIQITAEDLVGKENDVNEMKNN